MEEKYKKHICIKTSNKDLFEKCSDIVYFNKLFGNIVLYLPYTLIWSKIKTHWLFEDVLLTSNARLAYSIVLVISLGVLNF